MEQILEDVRKDAEKKLRLCGKEDRKPLYDSISNVLQLCKIVYRYGKAILDEVVLEGETRYVKTILLLMSGEADLDYIVEVGTNEYWMQDIQGIWAMVYYIYLLGALAVCQGEDIHLGLGDLIDASMPEGYPTVWDSSHRCFIKEIEINIIPPQKVEELRLREEESKKRKLLNDNRLMEEFLLFRPVFKSPELIKKLHELEKNIAILPNQSLRKIGENLRGYIIIYCLYGLCNEARMKILDNTNYKFFNDEEGLMPNCKRGRIEKIIEMDEPSEEEILGAVLIMLSKIKSFQKMGE